MWPPKGFLFGIFTYNFMPRSSRVACCLHGWKPWRFSIYRIRRRNFVFSSACTQVQTMTSDWTDKIFKRAKNDSIKLLFLFTSNHTFRCNNIEKCESLTRRKHLFLNIRLYFCSDHPFNSCWFYMALWHLEFPEQQIKEEKINAVRTHLGCIREIWSGKCDWCSWFNPKTTHFVYHRVYFIDCLTAKCSSPITSNFFHLQIALNVNWWRCFFDWRCIKL